MIFKFKPSPEKKMLLPESFIQRERVKVHQVFLYYQCPVCNKNFSVNKDMMKEFREQHTVMCGKTSRQHINISRN